MKPSALFLAAAVLAAPVFSHAYTFDGDVPEAVKEQITTDMGFMASLEGSAGSSLHKEIFESDTIQGAAYKNFFESRVTSVGMNSCGGGNAVACVIPWRDSSKIWLTQHYVRFSHPQVAKMMVVFHEARHTEVQNGNWHHANCPDPFLDESGQEIRSIWTGASLGGEAACDETAFGSYSSSMIMLKNISKFCTNCTDKVKLDAGIYADDQFKRVIDQESRAKIIADLYQQEGEQPANPGQPQNPVIDPPGFWDPWWPSPVKAAAAPGSLVQR